MMINEIARSPGPPTRLTKRSVRTGWRWWQRVFVLRWGVDVRLRRSWLSIAWRPRFAVWWSPDATPQHDRARRLIGEAW